jgi:diguanylate cyclase (GGDEF)-like protein
MGTTDVSCSVMEELPEALSVIRVLLVEDSEHEQHRIRRMLAGSNAAQFRLRCATCVEDALRVLKQSAYDIVLFDLSLPEGTGLEPLLRAKIATSSVPIIALTAENDDALAVRALRLGAQDYLVKPTCNAELLIRTIRHAIERHRTLISLQRARQREHFLATHDGLTGLPNRSFFQDLLQRSLAHAERNRTQLAVLYLDLDGFKGINDTLGHAVGDELLRSIGERLGAAVRRSDVVARLGGDEFAAMLQDIREEYGAAKVATNLVHAAGRPLVLAGRQYSLAVSVGIAMFPRDGTNPDTLMQNADAAMYQAKARGGGGYQFYQQGVNGVAARKIEVGDRLAEALGRREFSLHYQPLRHAVTGRVTGAEALLRWTNEGLGPVPPDEFVPLAEDSGLIAPVGEWVLRTACAEAKGWQVTSLPPIRVSVNVSGRHAALVKAIPVIVRESGIEPAWLELEITESTILNGDDAMLTALRETDRMGVALALDNFGTGYGSLNCLRRLPIRRVKIDRSLVAKIDTSSDARALTAAIVAMARSLELRIVGAGVETAEQAKFLREQGCDELQGYLFSPPLPAEEFARLLSQEPRA